MKMIRHWIDGAARDNADDRTAPVYDPATGQQTAEVVLAGLDDVNSAVAVAQNAFAEWGD